MKKTLFFLLAAAATLSIVGCQKDPLPSTKKGYDFTIERLRDVGQKIPNPKIDLNNCIPEGSKETLESVRYVEGKPIYYMDYMAKVDWESLLTQDKDNHFPVFCLKDVSDKISQALFRSYKTKEPAEGPYGSCSGFICKNSKGELLNCRNFDGDFGEMVVIFNHNVKPGEHKSVMMADLSWAQKYAGDLTYGGDSVFLKKGEEKEMNVLLRQPISTVDGMNDAGLVIAGYQLPDFQDQDSTIVDPYPSPTPRPYGTDQTTGKPQIGFITVFYQALTTCKTVDDVIDMLRKHDYVALMRNLNIHWCVSDASGKWRTLEYWKDENGQQSVGNPKGKADILYVYDEDARSKSAFLGNHNIAYEYKSMENYYYHPTPSSTFYTDYWQRGFGGVFRAHNMMNYYSLVMDEEEALSVLQQGSYGIEVPGHLTNWSCVYNGTQKTVLFTVRNQTDRAFLIDLTKDL
ncbi:MAG: linear amide C-N hydrolase [Bacteroidales bacterium]|nr:linear amide C-N hydrolase [Bacteroidales bacterium]